MYKEVLRSIEGIEIYPIIALLIFFAFFVGVIVWSTRIDKERLRELSILPLDGEAAQTMEGDGHE
ncbi:MAG: cbb3-type cytochrome c oxidase subunit 3 [Gemmatimonadetes bacterium]|mgnify:CR=1 FL=1|jgi:cytochrome c oxidase cbb3-type subunit IV|nr:cbb3-type cytochrome c oxidase subunit 3 [Gemmatimonadota bacterium]